MYVQEIPITVYKSTGCYKINVNSDLPLKLRECANVREVSSVLRVNFVYLKTV